MKPLLRKIFFWDEPAKGAFFALTLLFILPKCLYAIGIDFLLPLFLRGEKPAEMVLNLMVVLAVVPLLYALVAFVHFLPNLSKHKRPYLFGLCCCSVAMLAFWWAPMDSSNDNAIYRQFWWMIPTLYLAWAIVYAFHPAVKIWEWLLAVSTLAVGIASYSVLNIEGVRQFAELDSFEGSISRIGYSAGLIWLFFFCAILFFVASYLLFGRIVAKGGGVPFKSLFGRGVATLWIVFAVICFTSIGMALYARQDYRKARKELDTYWGLPVKTKTLVELYAKNNNINHSFWEEFSAQDVDFPEFFQKYDGSDLIKGYSDIVLPPDIHAEWKEAFNTSTELRHCEEMLTTQPPLVERKSDFDYDVFFSKIIICCREMARLEMWRVRFSLEDKDIESAKKALRRMDNTCTSLQSDYNLIAGLLWNAIEQMRVEALTNILASGLADEEWLREQSALLLKKEHTIPDVYKRMLLGEAANMLDTFDMLFEKTGRTAYLYSPESIVMLGREGAAMARCYCISDYADFPEKPTALLAQMLSPNQRIFGTKSIPKLRAALRISRGLIDAELARLKTGAYPATMDNLPDDPFTGKPLKYAFGDCEITENHFQLNEEAETKADETIITMIHEVQKQLGLTDDWAEEILRNKKYTFKPEQRTVNAVQIWSVGPDGIDDGDGISRQNTKIPDDIRFIIQIP